MIEGIKPREYQQKIFETCKKKNCLVVLPTGMGKTFIALMLAVERQKEFPSSKVLFLAPTRPLAEQHFKYFKKYLPELYGQFELFTGKVNAKKRKELWQKADVIFSTPQCIANDLRKERIDLHDVSLLIEDEAHRCLKSYDYVFVVEQYRKQAANTRILGLTASPGSDASVINEICENLGIEAVEIRTRESEDVKEYLQKLSIEIVKVDLPQEFAAIRDLLAEIFKKRIEELKNRKILFLPATKKNLLELQHRIMRQIAAGNKHFNLLKGASVCAQAIKLQHALEMIETQGVNSLYDYMKDLFEQAAQGKSQAVKHLIKQQEFNKAYMLVSELSFKGIQHPKLIRLKEIIEKEIKEKRNARIIVFSQYRNTAVRICKELNAIEGIRAKVFLGQAMKDGHGLTQKEQQEIINEFSLGKTNVLVATSVHPDEYIVLKRDNRIMIKKIGEFVDSFIKSENRESASKKISGWEILTSNGKNVLFKPVTHVHKHPTQNETIKLTLNSGFECFVTKNHSLFSFDSDNIFVPSIPEKNKFVALGLKCPNIEQNNKIDVIRELDEKCSKEEIKNLFGSLQGLTQARVRTLKTDYAILSKLNGKEDSITDLSNLSKKDYSVVIDCLNRLKKQKLIIQKRISKNYKNMSKITKRGLIYLRFLEWFFENVRYRKGKYRFRFLSISKNCKDFDRFFAQNINVNYGKTDFPRFIELNESLARFLGFYVSEGSSRKTKFTSDIFLAARDKKMQEMMKESVERGLKLKTRTNWRGIAIDSQIAYYLIKYVFKAGIGAYNKEVPAIIFTAPVNVKWEFLKAYFLGDGYLGEDKIVLTTVSRKLATGLILLLRMLGIKKITLHWQGNIIRLGIYESLPFAKIREKNEKRGHSYFSLVPTAINSKKAFEKYRNFYFLSHSHIKCRKNEKWDNDICFDYIKRMEKIERPKFVYDLSVKDTENFIGGAGLFCLHNSIGEEGLDLPEVNLVVFYEPIPSAIRKIQRSGRTARLMPGKLIILVTRKTRDEAYHYASLAKERKMYGILNNIKDEMKNKSKQPSLDKFGL